MENNEALVEIHKCFMRTLDLCHLYSPLETTMNWVKKTIVFCSSKNLNMNPRHC